MAGQQQQQPDVAAMSVEEWHGRLPTETRESLEELATKVERGDCIAFVGAGFSAGAGLPGWWNLLNGICMRAAHGEPGGDAAVALVRARLDAKKEGTAGEHSPFAPGEAEMLAQLLKDAMGDRGFHEALETALGHPHLGSGFQKRRNTLLQVPFRAILTTNFDSLLEGEYPTTSGWPRRPTPSASFVSTSSADGCCGSTRGPRTTERP